MLALKTTKRDSLEREFSRAFEGIGNTLAGKGFGEKVWTSAVLSKLAESGVRKGFKVCPHQSQGVYAPEWLYDLVWYTYSNQSLANTELILESEWAPNFDVIQYDFEKLLVGKCNQKVMVFQGSRRQVKKWLDKLLRIANQYQNLTEGERYFFVMYFMDEDQFEFQSTIVESAN